MLCGSFQFFEMRDEMRYVHYPPRSSEYPSQLHNDIITLITLQSAFKLFELFGLFKLFMLFCCFFDRLSCLKLFYFVYDYLNLFVCGVGLFDVVLGCFRLFKTQKSF